MKKENWNLCISIVAIVTSTIAICMTFDSFSLSETAYLGWIVAVLSTLVVILIGWQVYSFFDYKDSYKKNRIYGRAFKLPNQHGQYVHGNGAL
ncbi:MAG: hypothetical protein LBG96_03225 [Tannerella sp.]|jgi:cation transport ATPase|nr:hypothetical protein [Tannerella sp.]